MVLLSTHIICFGREIKKIVFQYALLSGGLLIIIIIIIIIIIMIIMIIIIIIKCDSENYIDFTRSVNLGPIIVDIITKKKN